MRESKPCWQRVLAQGFSSATELLDFLQLPTTLASHLAEKQFKTRVPRGFAARMQPGNAHDPLLLQVLATGKELEEHAGFSQDPLQEKSANPVQGLIHKYHGRVLLTLTGACAINCRYCFRRHFPYTENNPRRDGWRSVIHYIAQDPTITEVILSGGDPLLAKDRDLDTLFSQLSTISHLQVLRIHTRIPIVLPERIDAGLLALLTASPLQKVVVLHSNHAQELNNEVKQACSRLTQAGCTLLNQSVLLAGVNDDANILSALSHRLLTCGVLPYYLHVLDKVEGAAHFDLPLTRAKQIYKTLQGLLPGYLLPRLTREIAGENSKTLIPI